MSTADPSPLDPEHARLQAADQGREGWRAWGPYLSERAWGTVREDYSAGGASWDYFPHDHARSRAYRWSEDGLGGICDEQQRFCFAFAFWNGVDPILKERIFGLTGPQGNHGEDAKEYWWYLDSTPTHSYMRWRYFYPQAEFPYADLVAASATATRTDPEPELLDTGIFADDRFWSIEVEYAKAAPRDMAIRLTATNNGPEQATLHVLPTLWFRNTWSWSVPARPAPRIEVRGATLHGEHDEAGAIVLAGDGSPAGLACDNETNAKRLWNLDGPSPYPKDGINDHVVSGAASTGQTSTGQTSTGQTSTGQTTVNPAGVGTKAALYYVLTVPAGATAEIRLRLSAGPDVPDVGAGHREVMAARAAEADAFFTALTPAGAPPEEAKVLRQAVAGLMWSKQFYHYDVARWLAGDPSAIPPDPARTHGRNAGWTHMRCHDVISMPDAWEYPWFAAWDLAFHCVAIAHVDPGFAKQQLSLLLNPRYQHPDGQIPAYEWAFDDANPPVQAWAALRVFHLDGGWDLDFLGALLPGLVRNFGWWDRAKTAGGPDTFGGGFLGLDNVGPFERSWPPAGTGTLIQADGTAWMAIFAAQMAEITQLLSPRDPRLAAESYAYRQRFDQIVAAAYERGLWDEQDGFFFDVVVGADGVSRPVPSRSVVGLLPLAAVAPPAGHRDASGDLPAAGMVDGENLRRVLARMLDEQEFLSPYGVRSLSAYHRSHPAAIDIGGHTYSAPYEPAESSSATFGGNSNWRGPVWFPVNVVITNALRDHQARLGDGFTVEYPTGSGTKTHLGDVADALSQRMLELFVPDASGRIPAYGWQAPFLSDPRWREGLMFYEYFQGDNGAGIGASHQTGWTALVIDLICHRVSR